MPMDWEYAAQLNALFSHYSSNINIRPKAFWAWPGKARLQQTAHSKPKITAL